MDYSLTPKDFKECKVNPFEVDNKKDLEMAIKEVRYLKSFHRQSLGKGIKKNVIIKWILAVYQKGSPLLDIDNSRKRRIIAGHAFGFDISPDDPELFTEPYLDVIFGKNEFVNMMVIDYLRSQGDDDFAELQIYRDLLWDSYKNLRDSSVAAENAKLMTNIETIKKKIKQIEARLLMNDEDKGLVRELLSIMTVEFVDVSREATARALDKGIDPFGASYVPPYGKEYVLEYNEDINRKMYEEGRSPKDI
jgi:hypothetical protein